MTDRDVKVRILSEYYDQGSKAAERAQRRLATMQAAAANEDIAREARRAAAVVEANRRQAEAMQSFGRTAVGVSVAVAIGLGLSAKAAMDWESAWAGVRKTVDGSPEHMAALEAELRGLARTLPATHEEIAGVAEAAGQLGVKRQDIADFTRTMINMGETTNLTAEEAATSIAQLSNIMGIGADSADEMGSAIVELGNNGASTERDIVSMGLRIAGAGRTVGLSTAQVLGLSSALSSVGMEAEAGGTAISRVMLQIDRDVDTGSDTIQKYAQVAGLSAQEFAERWKTDAAGALNLFIQGLGRMQAEGGNTTAVLDEMGFSEVRVSDALRRAALSGDLLTESLETGSRAWEENNALTEEAAKRYETAEARLAIARNEINDAAIDIGATLLPVLADAAEGAAGLAAGFQSLSPSAQTWVTNLGAAAVGLGGLVGGAAIAIPKLQELRATVDSLHGGTSTMGKAIGGFTSFLTGPWGLAVGAAVLAGGYWLQHQGEIKRNVDALTQSLDEQTGAITDNTRAQTVQRLQDRGVLEAAQTLGLELDRVTDAALGKASAMRYVSEAVEQVRAAEQAAATDQTLYTDELVRAGDAANTLTRQLPGQRAELDASRESWQLQAEALGQAGDAQDGTRGSTEQLTDALDAQEQLAQDVTTAIDDLAKALDELNGPTLSSRDAQREWYEQLEEINASLEENGVTLDVTTAAGRANQEVLDGLARSGMARAQAVLEETGSVDQFNASLEASRQALYENAIQFGLTEEEAWAYVDSVLAVPDTAATQAVFDDTAARARIEELKRILRTIPDVVITPQLRDSNPYYANRADGAVVDYFARGGIRERHVAEIAPANQLRVWAEPETGGEAYIPLAPGKRARSEAILEDVAARFGMYVGRFANGGITGASAAPAASTVPPVHIEHVTVTDVEELARVVGAKQRDVAVLHNLASIAVGG